MGFVRGSDKTHEEGEFLRVTFQAKATGNTAISLYEDSVGADGYTGDISGGTVTVEAGTYLYGDIDGNGEVDLYDATLIMRYAVGLITLDDAAVARGNVSGDTLTDLYDATLIQRYAVGIITEFPVETAE